jgi:glycosyltransferase involved in cell wall biosynthesis
MKIEMKKVMYIAPRFHTNQYSSVKSLIENNVEVKYLVQNMEQIENYEHITPTKIGYSKISELLINIFIKGDSELAKKRLYMNIGIPPILLLISELKKFHPDIVILRERTFYSIVSNIICKLLCIKTLLYTQEPLFVRGKNKKIKKVYNKITKPFLPKSRITPVLGNSDTGNKDVNATFVPFVMSNNVLKREYLNSNKVNFLIVSKYQKIKRILETIEVFKKIHDEGLTNWELTVCGALDNQERQSVYDEIRSFINHHNLENKINLKYNISHNNMKEEYLKNDVSILASKRDYASVTPIEAMSFGLVNISSDGNGTYNYIKNGIDGYFFNKNDLQELYGIIKNLLSNTTIIEKMGAESLKNFNQKYSHPVYHKKLLNVYNQIVQRK